MSPDIFIIEKAKAAVSALYGADLPDASFQVQVTRKEFEGDYTLVVFPLLKVSRLSPEATGNAIGDWRMDGVTVFVTKEPCAMCAGAMVNARVDRVVYGLGDPRCGACGSALDVTGFKGMLHNVEVKGGVLELECRELMQEFFRQARERSRSREQGAGK